MSRSLTFFTFVDNASLKVNIIKSVILSSNVNNYACSCLSPPLSSLKVRSHRNDNDNGKSVFLFFPSRMGNIVLYYGVHVETCGYANGNDVITKWVLCPIVTATAMTLKLKCHCRRSLNEPLRQPKRQKVLQVSYFITFSYHHILLFHWFIKLLPCRGNKLFRRKTTSPSDGLPLVLCRALNLVHVNEQLVCATWAIM